MKNRVPKYPGRIELTDVLTGEKRLYDMTRADEPTEEGTPINKSTLLTDQTADRYGLDEDGTPDDAFAFLGNYTEWRWNRRTVQWSTVLGGTTSFTLVSGAAEVTVKYNRSVSFSSDGTVSLATSGTYSMTVSTDFPTSSEINRNLRGKYFTFGSNPNVYYFDTSSASYQVSSGSGSDRVDFEDVKQVSSKKTTGQWEEVRASTSDAYPDSGISGGYEYEALGMPLEKAAALPLSALLSMLAEQEQLRADVDFIAAMQGVSL